jgi:hypothetical protein
MSDVRVAILLSDERAHADADVIRDVLAEIAPYCRLQTHAFYGGALNETAPAFTRSVTAASWSDIVLVIAPRASAQTNAALIALRELSGYTQRFAEPKFARAWFTPNGRRSLYLLGAVPGAFAALSLALEYGCRDTEAAHRLRARQLATPDLPRLLNALESSS